MSRSTAYEREPCPVRVMGDMGGGFGIGIIGGTIWHSIKGSRAAPKGGRLVAHNVADNADFQGESLRRLFFCCFFPFSAFDPPQKNG
jgi:hypothetical protein